ncbi:unnamed protein product [Mucor hiemalis]
MSLTDEEFRVKLEKHFSLYRINLRLPIASQVAPEQCITPFSLDDDDWEIEIRAAPAFNEGKLSSQPQPAPGFHASGKGTFEYRVRPKHNESKRGKKFLHITPKQLIQFPRHTAKNVDIILPLVIGPIEIIPDLNHENDTHLPLELWKHQTEAMVYEGYRSFSTSLRPPVNIAIHEMWDSGIPGKIWDSALVMLDVMKNIIQHHPEYIDAKHTIDLSAGTGLLGLYIASIMASPNSNIKRGKITITELDEAVDLIDKNILINHYLTTRNPQCQLQTRSLLWGNSEQAEACGKADLIIASDVLYEAQFFEDLVKAFVDLSHKDTRIYIGYKRRGFDEAEEQRFWSLCRVNFDITLLKYEGKDDTDDVLVPPMTLETGVQLYRLTRLPF